MPVSELPEFEQSPHQNDDSPVTLLDPLGDTPLTLFDARCDELEQLEDSNWKTPLHLTSNEREIAKTPGTALVLGRSGTST